MNMPSTIRTPSIVLLILSLVAYSVTSVTVFPSNVEPRSYRHERMRPAVASAQDLFRESCPNEAETHKNSTIVFSSYSGNLSQSNIYPTSDSFVRGSIDAWAQHQHLVLRPDEVWFSILAQMNFFMSKNSETLRHVFVSHEGKEKLTIKDFSFERILARVGRELQTRVKTDWLLDWITPDFTTSTGTDKMTANVLMMGLMQAYFDFEFQIICGLPSVTLLGELADWENLLTKLDHFPKFGAEPRAYAKQLHPILSRFVQSFEKPDDLETRKFWNSIIFAEPQNVCGLPPHVLSGWLMGFFFWDTQGNPLPSSESQSVVLDGIRYDSRHIDELPVGYAQVPVKILKFEKWKEFPAYILAGNLGKRIRAGLPNGYAQALKRFNESEVDMSLPHGVLEPMSGWMTYGPAAYSDGVQGSRAETGELSIAIDQSPGVLCPSPREYMLQRPYDQGGNMW